MICSPLLPKFGRTQPHDRMRRFSVLSVIFICDEKRLSTWQLDSHTEECFLHAVGGDTNGTHQCCPAAELAEFET